MLRDLLQLVIYFLEMLISTVFFTSVSSRKDPAPIMLISGTAFFEVIAFINIFKIESVLLNAQALSFPLRAWTAPAKPRRLT